MVALLSLAITTPSWHTKPIVVVPFFTESDKSFIEITHTAKTGAKIQQLPKDGNCINIFWMKWQ